MKDAIRKECSCGNDTFCVYYYEDGTLDYIECSKCGTNIDWKSKGDTTPVCSECDYAKAKTGGCNDKCSCGTFHCVHDPEDVCDEKMTTQEQKGG